ncbi:unnamed protein product [Euphydryas editha]|uniref:Uncharacterized protein n=1 Tax=Euphydryas editha TaxID=104508 RepID=A0AAU9TZT2_EUPED|nr:unnamed protein product [Euphydryas editha]
MGDFNAKVGVQDRGEPKIGPHGTGHRNHISQIGPRDEINFTMADKVHRLNTSSEHRQLRGTLNICLRTERTHSIKFILRLTLHQILIGLYEQFQLGLQRSITAFIKQNRDQIFTRYHFGEAFLLRLKQLTAEWLVCSCTYNRVDVEKFHGLLYSSSTLKPKTQYPVVPSSLTLFPRT